MNVLSMNLRIVTDTVTITVLAMIAFFCLLDGLGRSRDERDPLLGYFALLSTSLSFYVFFDNSLSLLVFDHRVAAEINTVGIAFCSFVTLSSFLLIAARILGIPRGQRGWMVWCVVPALVAFSLSPFAVLRGWDWYMAHCDAPAIGLYAFTSVLGMGNAIKLFCRKGLWRSRAVTLFLASSIMMIVSQFFWRILINLNNANFLLNNSIILGVTALAFPVFLASRRSAEYRELQGIRDAREAEAVRAREGLGATLRAAPGILRQIGRREIEVCGALLEGLEYKEISERLGLSLSGVKKRVHSLYEKLEVQNRTELFNRVLALRGGMPLPKRGDGPPTHL